MFVFTSRLQSAAAFSINKWLTGLMHSDGRVRSELITAAARPLARWIYGANEKEGGGLLNQVSMATDL